MTALLAGSVSHSHHASPSLAMIPGARRPGLGAVRPLVDLAAVAHDHDAVREAQDLLELGGDEDHRHALRGQVGDQALDLRLGADVDAAGGLVEDQELAARSPASGPAAPSAGCRRRGCGSGRSGSAGRMSSASMYSPTTLVLLARASGAATRAGLNASTMFSATVRSSMIPSARRFSVEKAMRWSIGVARAGDADVLAAHLERAGVGGVGAEEQAGELGAAGAEQAGDADDLAVVQTSRSIGSSAPLRPSPSALRIGVAGRGRSRGSAARGRWSRARRARGRSSARSARCGRVGDQVLADQLAVAQDRHAVGDLVDLVEEVRDEHDRDAAGRAGGA